MIENKSCPRCSSWFAVEQVDGDFSGICPRCLAGLLEGEPESPLKPGATFGGFEILDVLGQGGMGVVYKARQTSLNRIVALKVLSPQTAGSKEFALRFGREAKVLASLNHPNVVQVHDFGREGDVPYLVMEYVDGETLESAMKRLDRARLLEVMKDVVRGLRKVHEAGLIHRDLKPANIFLTRDGAAKIGDFGLAVRTEADCHVTEHGYFVGTPHYASPEHAQGAAVDHRSDLYALGAILFEGFAGRPPFQAAAPAMVLAKHVEEPAPALEGPPDVAALVARLLKKEPAKRFASAAELEAALSKVSLEPAKRRPLWPLFAAAAALLLALFFFRPAPAGFAPLVAATDALEVDDFDAAAEAVERAGRDPAWTAQAVALQQRIAALSAAKQEEDLGHYYCFSKGEWEKGLPLIANGEESPYRDAARKDLAGQNPADAWLALAKEAKPRWAERMRERAWAWLDAANDPRAAELDKTLEARREIDLLRLSPDLSQGKLRTSELRPLPYLPPAAYDLEAEGEALLRLPGAGDRRVSGAAKIRVRGGEPRLIHVHGTLTKLVLRAVLPAPRAEVDDLVRRVDVKRDAVVGAWTVDGDALVSPVADYARIQIPVDLPEEYDFEARVERRQGSALAFGLVSGGRPFAVCVDSHYATLSGIDMIDGRRVQDNAATWKGKALQDFTPATVRVEVRRGGVRLLVDDRALVDWKGARERLSLPADWTVPKPLQPWVSAWAGVVRFSRITVTPADSLIERIDPARDAVSGTWTKKDGALLSSAKDTRAQLRLPLTPANAYELSLTVERLPGGGGALNLGLVHGDAAFCVVVDGWTGDVTGLELVGNRGADNNETTSRGTPFLRTGKPATLAVFVHAGGVRLAVDGRQIFDWKGNPRDLRLHHDLITPGAKAFFLGSSTSAFKISRLAYREEDVDLLRLIDPPLDSYRGQWATKDGALESPTPAGVDDLLQIPHAPPEEYELRATLARLSGNDGFGLGLVAGGRQFTLALGSHGGAVTGLSLVDGRDASDNETTARGDHFPAGVDVPVRVSVRKDRLQVFVRENRIIDWAADYARCAQRGPWRVPSPQALSLCAFRGAWAVRALSVSPAGSSVARPTRREEAVVDLLPIIDPARDAVNGSFTKAGDRLRTPAAQAWARLQVPYGPPDDYDVRVYVERIGGRGSLNFGLPWGGRTASIVVDGAGPEVSGVAALDFIDGREFFRNETTRKGPFLEAGSKHLIQMSVAAGRVALALDGKPVFEWKGTPERLGLADGWKIPDPKAIMIGSYDAWFEISEFSVIPKSGPGRRLAAAPAATDLLANLDVARHTIEGAWKFESGQLVSAPSFSSIAIPYEPADEYDLEMNLERKLKDEAVVIVLPVAGRQVALTLDSFGTSSGLDSIDGRGMGFTERKGRVLTTGHDHALKISVRRDGVRAEVSGTVVVDWKGDPSRLSLPGHLRIPEPRGFALATWTSVRVSRMSLRGPGRRLAAAPGRIESVDLLRAVNLDRDTIKGEWRRDGDAVVGGRTPEARLALPGVAPEEYDLKITAARLSADPRSFHVGLPVGGRMTMVTLDGFGGTDSGLENVDGQALRAAQKRPVFPTLGSPVELTLRVRATSIRVLAGGETVLEWSGNPRRLSLPMDWKATSLFVGAFRSEYRILRAELLPPGNSVDLLSLIDPARDAVSGTWTKTGGALTSSEVDFFSRLRLPVEIPAEYDVRVRVERREGVQDFYMGLWQGTSRFGIMLNAGNSTYSAIQAKVGELVRIERGVLEQNREHAVLYRVRKGEVEVLVDGARVLRYRGDLSRGSMFPQWTVPGAPALFIGSHGSLHVIRELTLTPVRDGRLDLLAITDPARDAVAGRWARSDAGLMNQTTDAFPRVLFPVTAPAEYDVEMDVERKEGFRSLILGLVSGASHFAVHIDGWTGTISGLDLLDNKGADNNETTTRDVSYLPLDKKVRVLASVRRDGVKVAVDGRVIIDWKGDARRLTMNQRNRPMPRPGLSVGAWDSRFLVHAATLTEK